MTVDLHLHSTASDGGDTPTEVMKAAAAAGLTTVALTDHDNLDGIDEARRAATEHGIEFIAGSELSAEWPQGAMHMLVYFLEPGKGPLQDRLVELQAGRHQRNIEIVAVLNGLGLDVTYEEVSAEAGGRGVGRPHVGAALVAKGYVETIDEAFDRFLANGRPGYVERPRLDHAQVIELARASGAVPVLAHPHTIGVNADQYGTAFRQLADAGLMGIESYYPEYPPDTRQHLASLAAELGMVATGGSDYHGRFKPETSIGTGRGDLSVPQTAADDLRAAKTTV